MDLSWLPLVALGIGLYFFFLMAYRLWVAGRACAVRSRQNDSVDW